MISESNCISIVDISMSVNIFDIFSYDFDQNRSALPKYLTPLIFENQGPPEEFFEELKLGGANAMFLDDS